VLSVLVFHADGPLRSGGVAGVTLFFVLSGYLIATLLMSERDATGTIDLRRFFARRAWRLLPALVVVMAALLLLRVPAGDAHELAQDSLLTLAYVANLARSGGDAMGWWNHAWSLSVEEQFYLVAPLAILLISRVRSPRSRTFMAALVVGIVGVALWRAALIEGGASTARIYFGTDTRVDALLLGCLLAAVRRRHPRWTPSRHLAPVALLSFGVLAMLPMVDVLGPGSAYTAIALASLGVVAAALGDQQPWPALDYRPLMWLGERSYSLYLVHVPVFMYLNDLLAGVAPAMRVGTAVLVSVALSAALFRYVERPLRYGLAWKRLGAQTERRSRRDPGSQLQLGPEFPA
jgi:peptidoglycan/LPS O-acetylase OafA/YrhL